MPPTRTAVRPGSRFDDTVAHPVDAPRRIDEVIRTTGRRLRRMPPPHELSRRTLPVRAQLLHVMRQAARARARLSAGTYGVCTDCSGPISLALLTRQPWTPWCVYCALDI